MTSQHAIDSELSAPPPRTVHHRDGIGAGCGLWIIRLFILPHMAAGVFLFGLAVLTTVQYVRVLAFGVECDGRVVQKTAQKGGKGKAHYEVEYAYPVDGVEHRGRVSVTQVDYEGLHEGDPVAVRALESDPENRPWPRLPGQSALRDALTLWGVALFWNGLLSVFVWHVYVHPWRARRLVRGGEPTTGMIRSWSAQPGKGGPSYRLTYEYEVPGPSGLPETRTGRMTTRRKQAADWRPGRPVTVVYDPAKPWRSVIYALGEYRAVVA